MVSADSAAGNGAQEIRAKVLYRIAILQSQKAIALESFTGIAEVMSRFCRFFCEFGLVRVFFHVQTNKMLNRMLSWSTSQTTGIYDYAFRQVCATFGIDKFQGEQQKAIDMFFEGNDVSVSLPTGHGNTSRAAQAPVVRRSSCVISVKGIM